MGKRYLLAIGGSKNFEWVPDMGPVFKTIKPLKELKFQFTELVDIDSLPIFQDYDTEVYHVEKIGDPETKAIKYVYVLDGFKGNAMSALTNYLMKQFINMEDPIDDSD